MAASVRCACCGIPIPCTWDDVGLTVTCPRTGKPIPVKASDLKAEPFSLDASLPLASPGEGKRATTLTERLIRVGIPLGYILFVFVPMAATIWFLVQRMEEARKQEPVAVAPKDTAEPTGKVSRPLPPDGEPKTKPKEKTKPPIKPKLAPTELEVAPEPRAVRLEPFDQSPAPRNLSSELESIVNDAKNPDPVSRRRAAVKLAAFLGRTDPDLRRIAAKTLSEMGDDAEPAIPALRAASTSDDENVQWFAMQAIDKFDRLVAARKADELRVLAQGLKSKEPDNRIRTLRQLVTAEGNTTVLKGYIVEAMRDPEAAVREAAVESLAKLIPKTDPKLLLLCINELNLAKEPKTRIDTLKKIAVHGPDAAIVNEFILEAMLDPEPSVKIAALETLRQVDPALHPHVVSLVSGSPDDRRKALPKIAQLGEKAESTIALILPRNGKPFLWGPQKNFDVFPTLAQVAPKNRRFADAVLESISAVNPDADPNISARRIAGLAQVAVINATTDEKVASLLAATRDEPAFPEVLKAWAATIPKDKQLARCVLTAISSPKATLSRRLTALAHLEIVDAETEEKVAALQAAASDNRLLGKVLESWVRLAPKDSQLTTVVLNAVTDRNAERRLVGIVWVEIIDATFDAKVEALFAASKDGVAAPQIFATLGKIAPKDKRFVAAVLNAVAAPNPTEKAELKDRRIAAVAHLKVIEASNREKVDALIAGMTDKGSLVVVVKSLEEFGADAQLALPALKELKNSPNATIRSAAISAMAKIQE